MTIFDTDEDETLYLLDVHRGGEKVQTAGISESGTVFLRGDLHPMGSFAALMLAAKAQVPYIEVNAVEVLYPADWLRGECLHDEDRQRVIDNAERLIRGARHE